MYLRGGSRQGARPVQITRHRGEIFRERLAGGAPLVQEREHESDPLAESPEADRRMRDGIDEGDAGDYPTLRQSRAGEHQRAGRSRKRRLRFI